MRGSDDIDAVIDVCCSSSLIGIVRGWRLTSDVSCRGSSTAGRELVAVPTTAESVPLHSQTMRVWASRPTRCALINDVPDPFVACRARRSARPAWTG